MTRDDGLLTDAEWDAVAVTLPTTALPVGGIPGRKPISPDITLPVVPTDEPRHVGDIPPAVIPRGYGFAHRIARNAWSRIVNEETAHGVTTDGVLISEWLCDTCATNGRTLG